MKRIRILLVEKNPLVSRTIKSGLERVGHKIKLVSSEKEALEALEKPTDLVFIRSGITEICVENIIEKARSRYDSRIILISSENAKAAQAQQIKLGAEELVSLPVHTQELRTLINRMQIEHAIQQVPKQPKLLVVDDDPLVVKTLERALKDYRPELFSSPVKALEKLEEEEFHLLLTDLKMDEMDGMELIRRVKEIQPALKVIVMTGYASKDTALEAIQEGVYSYLEKPIHKTETIKTIESAWMNLRVELENQRLLKELMEMNEILLNTQDQLVESQRMAAIGELATGVAHDFNNILAIVIAQSEYLLMRNEGNQRLENGLLRMIEAAERGGRLTNQLLGY